MEDNIFSGIPALDDDAGLTQYLAQETVKANGGSEAEIPAALRQVNTGNPEPNLTPQPQPQPQLTPEQPTENQQPTYTAEQVQAIIQNLQQQNAQYAAKAAAMQNARQTQQQTFQGYTPQEQAAISQLLAKGYSLEQVMQAVNNRRQATRPQVDAQLMQRLSAVEQYLQRQNYEREQNSFIDKMTTFGNRFGLSEDDLVTFGNYAMAKGINLTQVTDVEAIFRALYPEQYSIRMQRMSNAPTSQIYGGVSAAETPQAIASATADAYVENFLRRTMPNDYSRHTKK